MTKQSEASARNKIPVQTVTLTMLDRKHLGDALRIFGNRSQLRAEYCRALFKRSLLLDRYGKYEAAGREKELSRKLYRELYPRATTTTDALTEDDVDNIVAFWSR